MVNFDWEAYVSACLNSTTFCALATVDPNGAWSNPVYFAYDENWNLYFISQMHSRHMRNIKNDSRISVSVYSTEQEGDVTGVQIQGAASILHKKEEIVKAMKVYHQRTGEEHQVSDYMDDQSWIFVKVIPEKMYYFDSKQFGEERQEVPMH